MSICADCVGIIILGTPVHKCNVVFYLSGAEIFHWGEPQIVADCCGHQPGRGNKHTCNGTDA